MKSEEIMTDVMKLDSPRSLSVSYDGARDRLHPLGAAVMPIFLEAFPKFKTWQGRVTLIYHATKFARASDAAFSLGCLAIEDQSQKVRFQGCRLLAYSLDRRAIPRLTAAREKFLPKEFSDFDAAIAAISEQNHHLFLDRNRRGTRLIINPEDR